MQDPTMADEPRESYRLRNLLHPEPGEEAPYYPPVGTFESSASHPPPRSPIPPPHDDHRPPSSSYGREADYETGPPPRFADPYYNEPRADYPPDPYARYAVGRDAYAYHDERESTRHPVHARHRDIDYSYPNAREPPRAAYDAQYPEFWDRPNPRGEPYGPYDEYPRTYRDERVTPAAGPAVGYFSPERGSAETRYADRPHHSDMAPAATSVAAPGGRAAMSISSLLLNDEAPAPSTYQSNVPGGYNDRYTEPEEHYYRYTEDQYARHEHAPRNSYAAYDDRASGYPTDPAYDSHYAGYEHERHAVRPTDYPESPRYVREHAESPGHEYYAESTRAYATDRAEVGYPETHRYTDEDRRHADYHGSVDDTSPRTPTEQSRHPAHPDHHVSIADDVDIPTESAEASGPAPMVTSGKTRRGRGAARATRGGRGTRGRGRGGRVRWSEANAAAHNDGRVKSETAHTADSRRLDGLPHSGSSSESSDRLSPTYIEYATKWRRQSQRILRAYEEAYYERDQERKEHHLNAYLANGHSDELVQPPTASYDYPYGSEFANQSHPPPSVDYGDGRDPREASVDGDPDDPTLLQRRAWAVVSHRQVPKVARHATTNLMVRQQSCRRIAQHCQREVRRVAGRSARERRDVQLRAKRAMREMLLFWKRNEREEKEARKRAEKEAQERLRIEEERRETMRQNRKLNFLISQTEIFSHFVGGKLGAGDDKTEGQATAVPSEPAGDDEGATFDDIDFDGEDEAQLQARARQSAQQALARQQNQTRAFDANRQEMGAQDKDRGLNVDVHLLDEMNFMNPSSMPAQNAITQPRLLMCQLKEYQLKGLNWLANLYEQGINGILADEMGLGKTVQSISLLAYLAEVHHIKGPFLVVAPASTLHNWQQELTRFVPSFKVLPYWGNQRDRQTLRKLWTKHSLYTADPPFNVLVTSYQMVVTDERYFARVKWQYMVLDEAQAIKSSTSTRWRTLLGFPCRNRLLLTGTPIQNSMRELWALLHFIMPTLFDSHDEFSEWFARDIESHAENKTGLDTHQLSRLHMILKPFMLRRIKKHVQNELGDKIELELRCNLTARQRRLYAGLKSRLSVTELLAKAATDTSEGNESLMNVVMQFRKVCNHPELFERAEVEMPYAFNTFPITPSVARAGDRVAVPYVSRNFVQYQVPGLLVRAGGLLNRIGPANPSAAARHRVTHALLGLWHPDRIHDNPAAFGFAPLADYGATELAHAARDAPRDRWSAHLARQDRQASRIQAFRAANYEPFSLLLPGAPDAGGEVYRALADPAALLALRRTVTEALPAAYLNRVSPAYRPPVLAPAITMVSADIRFNADQRRLRFDPDVRAALVAPQCAPWSAPWEAPVDLSSPARRAGLTSIWMPAANKLIAYSGKMMLLDRLLAKLKSEGHRVLVYFQMTKMLDLMEEYLIYRQYTYLRLDGSSKISDRRDMVTDWQTRDDIFIFLLSTRAGGLGINLTAADTVIFYDSDWNPTVDQQAMDRAHRLGQTRQVTVYRLLTRGTIEEKILVRARQKDEIHKVVISGGDFKQQVDFKPKEIVSLLLDDAELGPSAGDGTTTGAETVDVTAAGSGDGAGLKDGVPAGTDEARGGDQAVPSHDPAAAKTGEEGDESAPTANPRPASWQEVVQRPLVTSRTLEPRLPTINHLDGLFDKYLQAPSSPTPATANSATAGKMGGGAGTAAGHIPTLRTPTLKSRKRGPNKAKVADGDGSTPPPATKRVRQTKKKDGVGAAATGEVLSATPAETPLAAEITPDVAVALPAPPTAVATDDPTVN
ncbi:putative DNA helicase ino80 [Tieghemiomyces parasiticus]|uniref:Chromatin-remodeling ATPase INO80 n=1 Tax=Tieghemiomyces parasiticus TaxID=78921 RepID=A0A9W7ZX48_9FUNG|nr:putative DNA helicase ino80 [Tieghemiomyces parasiticus]